MDEWLRSPSQPSRPGASNYWSLHSWGCGPIKRLIKPDLAMENTPPHFKTICEKTANRGIPQPTLYRMAVDGYHESQIRYLISLHDANLEGRCGQNRRQGKEGRLDEKTRRERRDSPPGQRGSLTRTGKMAHTQAIEIWSGLQRYRFSPASLPANFSEYWY